MGFRGGAFSTLGADPEFFLANSEGKLFPAHQAGLPYKEMPIPFMNGKALRDGYALELNPTADSCRTVMAYYVWGLLKDLRAKHLPYGTKVLARSAAEIDLKALEDAPGDVSQFGCDGAWNAYSQTIVKPSLHGPTHPLRYTGGHLHASRPTHNKHWAKDMDDVFLWAKLEDRFTGLISTYLTGSEWAGLRRQYYGQAGEFRLQEYPNAIGGLEYRTPGSEIFSHPALLNLCLGVFREVYEQFPEFKKYYSPKEEQQVRDAINKGESHDDLLDLIPELPGWYTRKLLKEARPFFQKDMHQDLVPHLADYYTYSGSGWGWAEWCKDKQYVHWRRHYFGGNAPVTPRVNALWGETAA